MSQFTDPAVLSRLLPCPFCGGAAELVVDDNDLDYPDKVNVWCVNSHCWGSNSGSDIDDAIAKWNKREPKAVLGKTIVRPEYSIDELGDE